MLVGAIESEFRRWFDLNKAVFQGRTLHIGCSGNFTIEQLLGPVAGAVHSNDVSIYSHILGHHLAGQETWCRIKDPAWEWLGVFLGENPGACIVLLFELLKWERQKNFYEKRIFTEMQATWEYRFEKTVERVEEAKRICRIASYRSSDIFDFADAALEIDPQGVFLAFLPFYKGGYERLYKRLDEILDWPRPVYGVIDQERKAQIVEKVRRFDHVIIDDVEHPGDQPVMLKRKTATKQMWLYSNLRLDRVLVQSHTKAEPLYFPLLNEQDAEQIRSDTPVVFERVKAKHINYYRNRFLAKGIEFQDGTWNFFVLVGGKLVGFLILSLAKWGESSKIYVMSDFVVPLAPNVRLAKLLLLLMQSVEFKDLCESLTLNRIQTLYTTAFTEKPVSMKHRGIWELAKRGEDSSGRKFLNYQTVAGQRTVQGAVATWIRKYRRSSTN